MKKSPGRKLFFPEKRVAAFVAGTLEAIDDLSEEGESRTDFIREAVDREIERRIGERALKERRCCRSEN